MRYLRTALSLFVFSSFLSAGEMVEVTATLLRVDNPDASQLSQLELRQQVQVAGSRGSEDLLKLSAVVESGKWATIQRGREFWYPAEYSEARVHRSRNDDGKYSIPEGQAAPGNHTIVLANSPTRIESAALGASLKVRPTTKEDGLIYLEGVFTDTVFEGLSEEAIPVKVEKKQLLPQNRVLEVMTSRVDKPVFRSVEKDFGVMLPYSAGSSFNAKILRAAKSKYTYFIPVVLGNTAFGAPGKIELKTGSAPPTGPIRSTMMKATMVKDFFIKPKVEETKREHGILILDVKKIELPEPEAKAGRNILLQSKFIESEKMLPFDKPVLNGAEFNNALQQINSSKGGVVSAPSIMIRSGNSGKIEMIREFIFPSGYAAPSLNPAFSGRGFPLNPARALQTETRNVGLTLEVKGTEAPNNMIQLKVKSSVLVFEGFLNFGNPVMAVKSGMIKKLKPVVADENKVEMPVFPRRVTETELLVPNGSHVAMTMIFDYHNINHRKDRLLKFRKAKVEEVQTPRYLTVFLSPSLENQKR